MEWVKVYQNQKRRPKTATSYASNRKQLVNLEIKACRRHCALLKKLTVKKKRP